MVKWVNVYWCNGERPVAGASLPRWLVRPLRQGANKDWNSWISWAPLKDSSFHCAIGTFLKLSLYLKKSHSIFMQLEYFLNSTLTKFKINIIKKIKYKLLKEMLSEMTAHMTLFRNQ